MGKYLVKFSQTTVYSFLIDATSEDEAQEMAKIEDLEEAVDVEIVDEEYTVDAL